MLCTRSLRQFRVSDIRTSACFRDFLKLPLGSRQRNFGTAPTTSIHERTAWTPPFKARDESLMKPKMNFQNPSHRIPLSEPFPGVPSITYNDAAAKEQSKAQCTTLANGIRVVSQEAFGPASAVEIFVKAGTMYESKENQGSVHMLEKMTFKATKNRSTEELISQLEATGGSMSVARNRDYLIHAASIPRERLSSLLELLADMVVNPRLDEQELEEQKQLVQQEYQFHHSKFDVDEKLHLAMYGDQPLGNPINATPRSLSRLKSSHLQEFHHKFVRPERIVVAATNVNHEELVDQVDNFMKFPRFSTHTPQVPPSSYIGGRIVIDADETETHLPEQESVITKEMPVSYLAIAFEGVSSSNENLYALAVLQTLLGGGGSFSTGGPGKGMYSRFSTRLLGGYMEAIQASNVSYEETGAFCVTATCRHSYLKHALKAICEELASVSTKISDTEFMRAQNSLKSSIFMHLELREVLAEDLARQILIYNQRFSPEEVCASIDKVTKTQVLQLLRKMLTSEPTVVAHGLDASQQVFSNEKIKDYLLKRVPKPDK